MGPGTTFTRGAKTTKITRSWTGPFRVAAKTNNLLRLSHKHNGALLKQKIHMNRVTPALLESPPPPVSRARELELIRFAFDPSKEPLVSFGIMPLHTAAHPVDSAHLNMRIVTHELLDDLTFRYLTETADNTGTTSQDWLTEAELPPSEIRPGVGRQRELSYYTWCRCSKPSVCRPTAWFVHLQMEEVYLTQNHKS